MARVFHFLKLFSVRGLKLCQHLLKETLRTLSCILLKTTNCHISEEIAQDLPLFPRSLDLCLVPDWTTQSHLLGAGTKCGLGFASGIPL